MVRRPIRKGRNYELKIYHILKQIRPSLQLSIWSGIAKEDYGDIFDSDFAIECKHYKKIRKSQMDDWYKKLQNLTSKKLCILIVKENYRKDMVYMDLDTFIELLLRLGD